MLYTMVVELAGKENLALSEGKIKFIQLILVYVREDNSVCIMAAVKGHDYGKDGAKCRQGRLTVYQRLNMVLYKLLGFF